MSQIPTDAIVGGFILAVCIAVFNLYRKRLKLVSENKQSFSKSVTPPSNFRRFTQKEFDSLEKTKMQEAGSLCPGHKGTTIWYIDDRSYIVEVQFDVYPSVYAQSLCSFTPTFGMDSTDGALAQGVEELILHEVLGFKRE